MSNTAPEIVFPFDPQKAQIAAARAMHPRAKKKMVGYGGSKFNGKSWTIDYIACLQALSRPVMILVIGHSYKDMKSLHIDPLKELLKDYIDAGLVTFSATDKQFRVPKWGSIIKFQQVKNDSDVMSLNGQRWDIVMIDEAQKFSAFTLRYLRGICGSSRIQSNWSERLGQQRTKFLNEGDMPKVSEIDQLWSDTYYKSKLLYCFNWGEKGHATLKRWFWDGCYHEADPIQRKESYDFDVETNTWDEDPDDFMYLFARMEDNEKGLANDPEYMKVIKSYPEPYRTAYMTGDPSAFQGLKYEVHPLIHEIDFDEYLKIRGYEDKQGAFMPWEWELYGCIDSGVTCAASLYCKTPEGKSFQISDYYQKGGMREHIREIIAEWERNPWTRGRKPSIVFGDRYMFAKHEKNSLSESELTWEYILENEHDLFCYQMLSDRPTAAMAVEAALHYERDEDGKVVIDPLLYFAKRSTGKKDAQGHMIYQRICQNTIEELGTLESDPKRPEDIKHGQGIEDHAFDKTKIYLMGADTPIALPPGRAESERPSTDGYGDVAGKDPFEDIEDADYEDIGGYGAGSIAEYGN